jgi:protein-disulfide isomerase
MAKKTAKRAVAERRTTAAASVSRPAYREEGNHPYSLQAMVRFFSNNAGLIFLGLAIFILGFLGGAVWKENDMYKKGFTGTGTQAGAPAAPTAPDAPAQPLSDADWKAAQENAAGVIGNKNAKVTMIEFTDYQCPFCGRHYTETYGQLKKNFVDTGKLKIIFKDQPLSFHPNSRIAALAARCAADQGKFEQMHDTLFGKQADWTELPKADAIAKFGTYANEIGANGNTLMDCVNTEKFGKVVDENSAEGNRIGAGATPTFFVEKEPLVGAMPYASFETTINKYL